MNNKINIKQVTAVVLLFVNLIFSFLPFFIIVEYFEIITKNSTWQLEYLRIWSDMLLIVIGIVMFVFSLITIIRYFRHKDVKIMYPVLFLVFYFIILFLPFLLF